MAGNCSVFSGYHIFSKESMYYFQLSNFQIISFYKNIPLKVSSSPDTMTLKLRLPIQACLK